MRLLAVLVMAGIVTAFCLTSCLRENGSVWSGCISTAVFVFVAWVAYQSIHGCLRVRVVPYFEKRLGGIKTFLAGEAIFLHSGHLDGIATQLGIRPLSAFASGDDLIWGECLEWFTAQEALRTVECLMQSDATPNLPSSVFSDLSQLRDALNIAVSTNTRFCLLIREGSSTSGAEMERRKGSFF